jgi:tight adherence protein B
LSALADADVPLDADRAWTVWLSGIGAAVVVGALLGGPTLATIVALGAVLAPPVLVRSRRGRRQARLEADLPAALEAIARALRSGASLRQAVAEAATTTPGTLGVELGLVASDAASGVPLVGALEELAARRPLPGVRLAVAALCLGAETGGAQARAVDGVAATLRDRLAVAGEVRALSAQTRASMLVIALAPLAFCAFASATDERTSTFLFRTPIGLACVVAGVGLDVLGALWMRRLSQVVA